MGVNKIIQGGDKTTYPLFFRVYVTSPSLVKVIRRITAPFPFRVLVGRLCSQRWRGTIYRAGWSGPPLFPPPTPLLGRGGINTWWYDVSMHYPSLAQGEKGPPESHPRATPAPRPYTRASRSHTPRHHAESTQAPRGYQGVHRNHRATQGRQDATPFPSSPAVAATCPCHHHTPPEVTVVYRRTPCSTRSAHLHRQARKLRDPLGRHESPPICQGTPERDHATGRSDGGDLTATTAFLSLATSALSPLPCTPGPYLSPIHIQEEPPNEGGSFSLRYTSCILYTCYQGESGDVCLLVLSPCHRTSHGSGTILNTSHTLYFALYGVFPFQLSDT